MMKDDAAKTEILHMIKEKKKELDKKNVVTQYIT